MLAGVGDWMSDQTEEKAPRLAIADATTRGYLDRWGLAVSSTHLRPDGVAHRKLGFGMAAQPLLHRRVPRSRPLASLFS